MIRFFLWVLNVAIAFGLTMYLFTMLIGVDIRSGMYLLAFMAAWSGTGHFIGKKHGYNSILSSWYTPFIAFDVNFTAAVLGLLTFLGTLTINKTVAWDLAWAIVPTIPITLIALTLLPFFKAIPYVRTLTLLATFQTLMIMALAVYVFKIDYSTAPLFTPRSSTNFVLIILAHIFIASITAINIYVLRNFEFYQKMWTNQDLTSKLSHKTKMQIAVHEASHAVMYAYFDKVPEQFDILLYEKAMNRESGSRGLVVAKIPVSDSRKFKEWEMMLSLAGIRGEMMAYGKHSLGSESDFKIWHELAAIFLAQYEQHYTAQPTTPAQMHTNKKMEAELFDKHIKIIDAFLKRNKAVVMAIARQAMVFHSLESHQLKKHLDKINYTSKFPREKKSIFG